METSSTSLWRTRPFLHSLHHCVEKRYLYLNRTSTPAQGQMLLALPRGVGWALALSRIHSSPEGKAPEPFTALSRFVHSACTGQESCTSFGSPPGPRWVSPRNQAQLLGVCTRPLAAACGTERCWTSMMGPKAQLLCTSLGLLNTSLRNPGLARKPRAR